jgi:hypothetical protein
MTTRILIAAVLALAALLGLQTLRLSNEREAHANTRTQAAEDRAAYDRERARVAVAFGKSVTQALATQQALADQFIQAQEEKHAQVSAARADADRLRDRLRCPAPPKLPPLSKPSHLEQSFLLQLETALFRSHSEPTNYGLTPSPATEPTKAPRLRLNP